MSRIKGINTRPEKLIKKILSDLKIPFKSNYRYLIGKPDIYIPDLNIIININGCFWHGHKDCRYYVTPKTNVKFWQKKINDNIKRDLKVDRALKKSNFKVYTVWECEFKNGKFLDKMLAILNLRP